MNEIGKVMIYGGLALAAVGVVVLLLGRHPLTVGPVEGHVDRVALLLQAALDGRRQPLVVLDHEDPHPPPPGPWAGRAVEGRYGGHLNAR